MPGLRQLNVWGHEPKAQKRRLHYRDYCYYACTHRMNGDGHSCTYKRQWSQDKINDAVAEVIRRLVQNPKF